MHANLVCSAGLKVDFKQGVPPITSRNSKMSYGLSPVNVYTHSRALTWISCNRSIDRVASD